MEMMRDMKGGGVISNVAQHRKEWQKMMQPHPPSFQKLSCQMMGVYLGLLFVSLQLLAFPLPLYTSKIRVILLCLLSC